MYWWCSLENDEELLGGELTLTVTLLAVVTLILSDLHCAGLFTWQVKPYETESRRSSRTHLSLFDRIHWLLFLRGRANTSHLSILALNELLQVKNEFSPPLDDRRQNYFFHVPDGVFRHRDMEWVFQGHTGILEVSCSFLLANHFPRGPFQPFFVGCVSLYKLKEWNSLNGNGWEHRHIDPGSFCTENAQLTVVCGYLTNYCNSHRNWIYYLDIRKKN